MDQDNSQHIYWMTKALTLAKQAEKQGEVPVGAIVVIDDEQVGEGWNQVITLNDPSAHAEVMALRDAGERLGNYRHPGSTLYVTLEPCMMCAGALVHARVDTVVFGAYDEKTGVAESVGQLFSEPFHNHQVRIIGGLLNEECSQLLSDFFSKRRQQKRTSKFFKRFFSVSQAMQSKHKKP
jgi:tRNA(adenine34) deaminase